MWPFREFNPRMVCAGEYRVIKKIVNPLAPTNYPTSMQINFSFQTHGQEIYWCLKEDYKHAPKDLGTALR
jgi:hypothetical protein